MNKRNVLEAQLAEAQRDLADARNERDAARADADRYRRMFLDANGRAVGATFDAADKVRDHDERFAHVVAERDALRAEAEALRPDAEAHRAERAAYEAQRGQVRKAYADLTGGKSIDDEDDPQADAPVPTEVLALLYRPCATCGDEDREHDQLACERSEELKALRLALRRYAQHDGACPVAESGADEEQCDCGLSAVLGIKEK